MKVKDITETGFYLTGDPEILYEVIENTDEVWVKEEPNAKLLIDEWTYDKELGYYETSGNLYTLYSDLSTIDVEKTDKKYKVFGSMGQFCKEL